jgi:hypothetical protein
VRHLISWLAALAASTLALLGVLHALAVYAFALPVLVPLPIAFLIIMIVAAAPAAVIGRWGPDFLPRLSTAALVGALGAGATLLLARSWPSLTHAALMAVVSGRPEVPLFLVLVGLAGVSAGAMLGAIPVYSERILAALAFATRHGSILVTIGAVALGGLLGFTLAHPFLYGFFAPCGMIAGMVVAGLLAMRANRLLQRTAGHP